MPDLFYVPKDDLLDFTLVNPVTGKVNTLKKWLITSIGKIKS